MNFALLCVFAFLSYFSATLAGFGGVIIVLTLGAHLYPIKWLLPVLLPLTVVANLYLFLRHRKHIDIPVLTRRILPLMGTGLAIGFALFNLLHGELLRTLFGALVVVVAARELIRLMSPGRRAETPVPGWVSTGSVFMAGMVHGIYASGGPLLVYAANKMKLSKSAFRSTLSAVWLIMNVFLSGAYAVAGAIDAASLRTSFYLLPPLILGVLLGEALHRHISERKFQIIVFLLLLLSGVFIALK